MYPPDEVAQSKVHAQLLHVLDLLLHDVLGQAELGYAVDQHPAGDVQRFEQRHLMAQLHQVGGDGEARGPGTDDRDLLSGWRSPLRHLYPMLPLPVRQVSLQAAYADRVPLLAQDARLLALLLLGADTAANGRKSVLGLYHGYAVRIVAFVDALDEIRYRYVHGAALSALRVLALKASAGLLMGHLLGVAQSDLAEVLYPLLRLLLGHLHCLLPPRGRGLLVLGLIAVHSCSLRWSPIEWNSVFPLEAWCVDV